MTLDEYQALAAKTDAHPHHSVPGLYHALGLAGEAGECAEKVKKHWRDNSDYETTKEALVRELGDVLWYVAGLARMWGVPLSWVAKVNVEKLASRAARNLISGEGDDR